MVCSSSTGFKVENEAIKRKDDSMQSGTITVHFSAANFNFKLFLQLRFFLSPLSDSYAESTKHWGDFLLNSSASVY